jgi:type III restriction enzyme
MHDYLPDFIIRSEADKDRYLILEVKGYDPLEEVKTAAALRWVNAVNRDGRYGSWRYGMIKKISELDRHVEGELG